MIEFPTGKTFFNKEDFHLSILRRILVTIAQYIQNNIKTENIILYDDWWQHDGLHFKKGKYKLSKLFEIIASEKSLHESMSGDHEVRIGISDLNEKWYLRFFVDWDDDDKELVGNFHFSIPDEISNNFKDFIKKNVSQSLEEADSKDLCKLIIQ